nr:hypothetical protein [Rhodothermus marinus]
MERFERLAPSLSTERICLQAERFSVARFRKAFGQLVARALEQFSKRKQQVHSEVSL